MKSSKQARRDAKELFRSTFVSGVMNEAKAKQAVSLLLDKKPRGYVGILEHFKRLIKLEIDRRTATVESPLPLGADQRTQVQQKLTAAYGPGLNFVFSENPALLGGLRIKVGSDVYDGSVQNRLKNLETAF